MMTMTMLMMVMIMISVVDGPARVPRMMIQALLLKKVSHYPVVSSRVTSFPIQDEGLPRGDVTPAPRESRGERDITQISGWQARWC